ncbi:hypothetical protein AAVH_20653 [Aphelenchoides avenae]|nr:hypothetical protein AAVH_20653 [Aphelenchus avenae]
MRAQTKSLNRDTLNIVAKKTARRRLTADMPRSGVAEIYLLGRHMNRAVLSRLEACDSVVLSANKVVLWKSETPNDCHTLDPETFAALCEHKGLVLRDVRLQDSALSIHKLSGIEKLDMRDLLTDKMNEEEVRLLSKRLLHVFEDNKNTLKVLLGVWKERFELLPSGLHLDEFVLARSTKSEDIKIPGLDTKLFKYNPHPSIFSRNWADTTPLPFIGINADEIHLEVVQLRNIPHDPSVSFAHNSRLKKLRIAFCEANGCDFARMFRQVTACCPSLEHFELLHEHDIYHTFDMDGEEDGDYDEYRWYVDEAVARYERVLLEADMPYTVHLKAALRYHEWEDFYGAPPPVAGDFTCGLLKSDLPCTEDMTSDQGYVCFVKRVTFGQKLLDVHCDVQHV